MNPSTRRRRRPRKASAAYLERAALHHLQRYSTTVAGLRRVLRRVARSARAHGTDPMEGRALVEELIARLERSGLLDDRRFAQARSRALLERGTPFRAIALKLRARGVASEQVVEALAALREAGADRELEAARALARRKRLGPFRDQAGRAARRDKDLAAMVRAGFSFSLARKVIDSPAVA